MTTTAEAPPAADAMCDWGQVELSRLRVMAGQLGKFGHRWQTRAVACRGRGEHDRAAAIEDMLGELGEIMARPGRRGGPHSDHLTAAQWHLAAYVAATRPRKPD